MKPMKKSEVRALVKRLSEDMELVRKERPPGSYRMDSDMDTALDLLGRMTAHVETFDSGKLVEKRGLDNIFFHALCTLMTGKLDDYGFSHDNAESKKFELVVLINGVPASFKELLTRFYSDFDWATQKRAYKIGKEVFDAVHENLFGALERRMKGSFRDHVEAAFKKAGLDIDAIHEDNRDGAWEYDWQEDDCDVEVDDATPASP